MQEKTDLIPELKKTLPEIRDHVPGLMKNGAELHGPCPFCGGEDRFFLRPDGFFGCRQCTPRGGDKIDFFQKLHGTTIRGLAEQFLGAAPALPREKQAGKVAATPANLKAEYLYRDEAGKELFRVRRYEANGAKTFRQGHFSEGRWVSSLKDIRRVLYRLPEVVASSNVLLVEGEKDADNAAALGFTATTGPMGASSWKPGYAEALRDKHVAVLPDKDEPGQVYLKAVIRSLVGVAASVRTVLLPGPGKDISDWIQAGGTKEQLVALIEETSPLEEEPDHECGDGNPLLEAPKVDKSLVIDKTDFMRTARKFLKERGTQILTHRGEIMEYQGGRYVPIEPPDLGAALLAWAETQIDFEKKRPFKPNRNWRVNMEDSVKAITNIPARQAPPCWTDGREEPQGKFVLACENGLLDVRNRTLTPATPKFFTRNALPYGFDPEASYSRWFDFLLEVFDGDTESMDTLQQLFGYLLTNDTTQQKIFLIVGPKRSGKGTIARVLTELLGRENVAGPTLNGLAQQFGLAGLIGKPLAIISDARLSSKTDKATMSERLLSISGEDFLSIPRKYLTDVTMQLPTRILIFSNEMPNLGDVSGALASRFITLIMPKSFFGKEDPQLTQKLIKELPGILNWSLDGRDLLEKRGYFSQPESSIAAMQELEDLSNPIRPFIRERCITGPGQSIECWRLFQAWEQWCLELGQRDPGSPQKFGIGLKAAEPKVETKLVRILGGHSRNYMGISLS
ncbi:phage/plasmid primase, P4 family [Desulfobotulus alkaliphilus]|nr:phage/plasmid primase, P4 family [Desulfobotulus alkaliphilus]